MGDNILFSLNSSGEIVMSNASASALLKAQNAFSGAAERLGVSDEEDVQYLVDSIRYEYWRNYTSEGGRAVSLQGCE